MCIRDSTGSLARTPACDYAIRLWEPEDISLRQLVDGLDRLWKMCIRDSPSP